MSSVPSSGVVHEGQFFKLCENCGTTYKARRKSVLYGNYCKAGACVAAYSRARALQSPPKPRKRNSKPNQSLKCSECGKSGVIARGLCPTHYSYWRRENVVRVAYMHNKICAFCGKGFQAQTKRTLHCSSACGKRNLAGWSKSKEIQLFVTQSIRREQVVVHVRTERRLTSGKCHVCNEWFISVHADITCSIECYKAKRREQRYRAKSARRARKREAFRAPVYRKRIFESDGYRCHICGLMTKRDATVPHPMAPTIDHLVPLAKGGTHEPINCRTAHFRCNAIKGDRLAGDQLILFNM